jgi:hypothetical protein
MAKRGSPGLGLAKPAGVLLVLAAILLVDIVSSSSSDATSCFPMLGSLELAHCALPYSWEELASAYKQYELDFMTGGLGACTLGDLKSWLCVRPHPCSGVLERFCFAYNESSHEFVPLGKNKDLGYCSHDQPSYKEEPVAGDTLKLACCDEAAATLSVLEERLEARIQYVNTSLMAEVTTIFVHPNRNFAFFGENNSELRNERNSTNCCDNSGLFFSTILECTTATCP